MSSTIPKTVTMEMHDHEAYDEFVDCEEEVDPRVKQELEILNQAGADVNQLEKELDEARAKYQATFSECSQSLEALKKKDAASIKRARPYFELKEAARKAQSEAVLSARKFQSANSIYLAAKETISLAELRLMDDKTVSLSKAWQEMLNHAVIRVMEAEAEKSISEKDHCKKAAIFSDMEKQLNALEKKNKRSIAKARVYFDVKNELEVKLQQLKQTVEDLQRAMKSAKQKYAAALKRLEQISDSIHEKRKLKYLLMYPREPGVGAEESNEITEHHLPSLYSSYDADGKEYFYNYDVCEQEVTADDDDACDIENEKVFREMILTISLDDDDTSFMKHVKNGKILFRRQRSRSLPSFTENCLQPNDKSCLNRSFNWEFDCSKFENPFWDRADTSPPDGNSLSSEKNDAVTNDLKENPVTLDMSCSPGEKVTNCDSSKDGENCMHLSGISTVSQKNIAQNKHQSSESVQSDHTPVETFISPDNFPLSTDNFHINKDNYSGDHLSEINNTHSLNEIPTGLTRNLSADVDDLNGNKIIFV